MNYSTDRPIEKEEQDLLGRATFSKRLGQTIYEYDFQSGLVIGVFGKWGSGKTSVINMASAEIEKLAKNDKNKPIIFRFSPWNFSDKDNLISLFFENLKNKLEIQSDERLKRNVGKALHDYAGALDVLAIVPVIGSGMAAIIKTIMQVKGSSLMEIPDLEKTRKKLEEELIKSEKKIIIIIDDIDRLTNSQIRDVFQLVKQVADFPNIIYVLSMDRDVVSNALAGVHNIDGNEYLEKIIQVPFELPDLRKSKLKKIFLTKIDEIINEYSKEFILDPEYWNNVVINCINPFINNLRDVNRIANIFRFKYGALYQETAFEDLLSITVLEVLQPKLYKWIRENKESVCGGYLHGLSIGLGIKKDYQKIYREEFERLGINSEMAMNCLSTLFPIFAKDINNSKSGIQLSNELKEKMRIADSERFDLYFMFDLDDIKVSRNTVNACVYHLDREQLYNEIKNINESGNIVYFLEEINALKNKIPNGRVELIASTMLKLHAEFKGEKGVSILMQSASGMAYYFIMDILKMLNEEKERYRVIYSALEDVDKDGLGPIARIINSIELSYGRLAANSENKDNQIINLEHLEELEKLYAERMHDITDSESILEIKGYDIAFYLWDCFDKEGVQNYLKNIFEDNINKLKFICSMAGKWNGTNGSGWAISQESYEKYIKPDEVYTLIQNIDKKELNKMSEIEQTKLASFVLNYERDVEYEATEQEAEKLVDRWKLESVEEIKPDNK